MNLNQIKTTSLLLLLPLLFFSCNKEQQKDESTIYEKWVNTSGQYLKLTKEHKFETNIFGETNFGTYQVAENTITLNIPVQNKTIEADSIVNVYDEQGDLIINHYNEGQLISSQKDGTFTSEEKIHKLSINDFSENNLTISGDGINISFNRTSNNDDLAHFSVIATLRGLLGLFFLLLVAYIFSSDRKKINWKTVGMGVSLQLVLAILVLKVPFVKTIFDVVSKGFVSVLNFTKDGSAFLFGGLVTDVDSMGFIFAFQILPTIIFFAALSSALYYLGIIQWIVYAFAWIMSKTMKLSGAESLAAAGNIFLGQTESPLLVKPYLKDMTKSEIMCLMTGGMATIAGGVLGAYVGYLGGDSIQEQQIFASHLLAASIMSAPAAIVAAKMLVPETAEHVDDKLTISKEKVGANILDAISNGTRDGLSLAVNVGAMLLVFTAFMYMFNAMSFQIGDWLNVNDAIAAKTSGRFEGLTLQYILGMIFSPVAWLLGVDWKDSVLVGQLLGEKTILNEFFAYASLGKLKAAELFASKKSIIIATYALCGFANFASIGIQIGGIGALARNQQSTLAKLGIKSLIGGTIACFMTATIAGMLF
ncbi:MAG: hypothetical protein H6578_08460 [Chitinophagales bacterium]|nr:hypothetical protein [Chitinophagales bacterium]